MTMTRIHSKSVYAIFSLTIVLDLSLPSVAEVAAHPDFVATAVADLADRLGINHDEIEVRAFEALTWPDSSLGCPKEGMMYAQVLTEGSRIKLAVGERLYAYHAAEGREPFLCDTDRPERTAPTLEQLSNATYQGIYEQPVRLAAGRFEGEPFAPGAASRPTVTLLPEPLKYADLDEDGSKEAIVLLAENSGGSGAFVYLAVVGLVEGEPRNLATALVGDRVRVLSLDASGARISARLIERRPAAASESSSGEIVREWNFGDGGLTER